jgi:uncharacterized protein YggU (UPF0235/DUF167 family)
MFVKVHVYAGMRHESIKKIKDHTYQIVTKSPAKRNVANQKTKEIIAQEYGVVPDAVRIVLGHHSQQKLLEVISGK